MVDLFKIILEISLFSQDSTEGLVLIPDSELNAQPQNQGTGSYFIPKNIFPEKCKVQILPNGEGFLHALTSILSQTCPSHLFIIPPFGLHRYLSEDIRTEFPRLNLEEIALKLAIKNLPSGSLVGALLPLAFFANERGGKVRENLFSQNSPRFFITHDHSCQLLGFNIHNSFRMSTLILEIGQQKQIPLKFFKYSEVTDENQKSEIISDFQRLCQQEGGKTKNSYGYVLRENLPPGAILLHNKYHPELRKRLEDLAKLGRVRPLGELCDLFMGLNIVNDAAQLLKEDSNYEIPVIEGRDILQNGNLVYDEPRYKAKAPLKIALEAGDICLRRIINFARCNEPLPVAEIIEEMLPLTASHTVIILRPKLFVTTEERELLLAYLRSDLAITWLDAQGIGSDIKPNILKELPIPLPDKDLSIAIQSLNEAVKQFEKWKTEAEQARNQIFKFASAQDTRLHLLTVGRQARQREEAAKLVDDLKHRIRTRFPHPIAYRWRTVESSHPNLEGYIQVLECAEVAICYLAQVCILLAKSVNAEIRYIQEMAQRISELERGTNLGDWITIIKEICNSKQFRKLSGHIPFYEVLNFLNQPCVNDTLHQINRYRNDQAHGRGPKTSSVIQETYKNCLSYVVTLLENLEFLSEYPLRYIESTKRDSFKKITIYSYRDLMGDHPLVSINMAETDEPEIEAQSLYLVDRDGRLHLLRPLLNRRECPKYGTWEIFYLDSYKKSTDCSILKSLEHGHTLNDSTISPLFRHIGMLKFSE
ncbi:hypothetical protein [Nostoc sp. FACHB-145]|uniref:hypothetical protein n=1 Tax=Nostoc sp. FACHB-145 TaxID=2692836 RepID=UPI001686826D|nr:hypothetical protein [Nostoc sp. FACHB-145]MBD2471717.1 hypothetical protein [Nostoc sp. FACHB-145]